MHVSQRQNDHHDPQHGHRAADFAVRLQPDGVICELADQEFGHLCEAMRLQGVSHTARESASLACWDSDRLGLAHVGTEPEVSRLQTMSACCLQTIRAEVRFAVGERRQPIGCAPSHYIR